MIGRTQQLCRTRSSRSRSRSSSSSCSSSAAAQAPGSSQPAGSRQRPAPSSSTHRRVLRLVVLRGHGRQHHARVLALRLLHGLGRRPRACHGGSAPAAGGGQVDRVRRRRRVLPVATAAGSRPAARPSGGSAVMSDCRSCCWRLPGRRGDRRSGLAQRRGACHSSCQADQLIERAITSLGGGGGAAGLGWVAGGRSCSGGALAAACRRVGDSCWINAAGRGVRNSKLRGGHVAPSWARPWLLFPPGLLPSVHAPGHMSIAQMGWVVGVWHSWAGRRCCRRRRQLASAAAADPSSARRGCAML